MSLGFVDSGAWIALAVDGDSGHASARRFYRALGARDRLVTTNYVVAETLTWVRYRVNHHTALAAYRLIEAARTSHLLELEWVSPERHTAAWEIFRAYADQVLSFADCTSAVVGRELSVDYVFSFDSDFSILGFDVRPGP